MAILKQGSTTINSGAKGDTGADGADGAQGVDGADGIAAVVTEKTDNKSDASLWTLGGSPNYLAGAWIVVPTNGATHITVWDSWGLQSFGNAARPQVIEFNVSDAEVKANLTDDGEIFVGDGADNYKRWELDATTTYVHVIVPDGNAVKTGVLTEQILQDNMRITLGAYFTQESQPDRIKSIDGVDIPLKQKHDLFGKNIIVFGDSICDQAGTIGSRGSISHTWVQEMELTVFNFAKGSADLVDNANTTGVIDCDAATVNPENVVSNQIGCFETKGIIPDVVLLTGGTNDANDGKPDGTLSTAKANYLTEASQDKETFYGVLFWAVKTLRDLNPNVNIFIMGAIDSIETNSGLTFNAGLIQIRNAMQTTANSLSCSYFSAQYFLPILDGYGGVDTFQANDYYYDYLHPTTGAKSNVLAPKIMSELIKNNK